MQAIEYRTADKSAWGDGPWQSEPDKMQFVDDVTGLPCLIVRNRSGALCGYVGVAEGHPAFGADYSSGILESIAVHGGLTFADKCQPSETESRGICHIPGSGEPDHVWWLGFDCAHYRDTCPAFNFPLDAISSYRDVHYVKSEIADLACQLHAIAAARSAP